MLLTRKRPTRFISGPTIRASGPQRHIIESVVLATKERKGEKVEEPQLNLRGGFAISLNATNEFTLRDAYGDETDDWTDKPVIVFYDPDVRFGRVTRGGLRLRVPTVSQENDAGQ